MKIPLSLAENYVSTWGLVQAVREIHQNALDQQVENPENIAGIDYDYGAAIIRISSKNSSLSRKTLMLGTSSKRDSHDTIGQFGEGYKLALLVLTRIGKKCEVQNFKLKELWTPSIEHNKYFADNCLHINISKFIFTKPPFADLVFEIHDISPGEWLEVQQSNLHTNPYPLHYETDKGNIITDERLRGRIYVNGLYISTNEKLSYAYDFKPSEIALDRDRRMVRDFELYWSTSKLWASLSGHHVTELLADGCNDVMYINHFMQNKLADDSYTLFRTRHGEDAIPVTSQEEMESIPAGAKAVIVSEVYANVIKRSGYYRVPEVVKSKFVVIANTIFRLSDDTIICDHVHEDFQQGILEYLNGR
jgi:hypothetical protein